MNHACKRLCWLVALGLTAGCGSGDSSGGSGFVFATLNFPAAGLGPGNMDVVPAFPGVRVAGCVGLANAGDGTDRLFLVEQTGRIHVFPNQQSAQGTEVFLDITARIIQPRSGEEGFLGLTFDPAYASNGYFYVYYTAGNPRRSVIARYTRDALDPDRADPASERIVLEVDQPFVNHNAGMLAFGPDRQLYVALGDGGSGGDPFNHGQDLTTLLGSLLRIDPHGTTGNLAYGIPADNPFVGRGNGVREEIWAYGLRNPWRFSFDRLTGELWLGDVGQGAREEVDFVVKGGNYGWRVFEGLIDYDNPTRLPPNAFERPVVDYDRSEGASVIGGYVYRGTRLPELAGRYVHADYMTGNVWALLAPAGQLVSNQRIAHLPAITSFGEDEAGELYIVSHGVNTLWQLARRTGGQPAFPQRLSETGLLRDTASFTLADGVLEYDVQSPLWSDGSSKRRFLVLPNGGRIDPRAGGWLFPTGTVLVKHFELELVQDDPLSRRRLETRFLVRELGGWTGYTYRWNAQQTDADLITDGASETLTVQTPNGPVQQLWSYPSRANCLQCHTAAAGNVLGVRLEQLDRQFVHDGLLSNQLDTWSRLGLFGSDPGRPAQRLPDPHDAQQPIVARVRSYLDVNCAMCHRPDGSSTADMDLRFATSESSTRLIDVAPTHGDLGLLDPRRVAPGAKERSVLWERLRRTDGTRMPPLASHFVDQAALALIGQWIDSMQ